MFCRPIPIKDQPLCPHFSIFHCSSPSSCNPEAQSTSLPTQLFLYISWPCQVPFPLSLFMSSHKLHTIMILWIYLSFSNPRSIDAPLFCHRAQPRSSAHSKKFFRKNFSIFYICKNLLFMGETMNADSSHKKKKNKKENLKWEFKDQMAARSHFAINWSFSLSDWDIRKFFFSLI